MRQDTELRNRLLSLLGGEPLTVIQLTELSGAERSAVGRIMGLMVQEGFCDSLDLPNPSPNGKKFCKGYLALGSKGPDAQLADLPEETPQPTPPVKGTPRWIVAPEAHCRSYDSAETAKAGAEDLLKEYPGKVLIAQVTLVGESFIKWS